MVDDGADHARLDSQLSDQEHARRRRAHGAPGLAYLGTRILLDRRGFSDRDHGPTALRLCHGRARPAYRSRHIRDSLVAGKHGPWIGAQLAGARWSASTAGV